MGLPKIDVPVYTITLKSNGQKLDYRPFTVKEEKLFLMANESDDVDAVIKIIKQILNNCILTDNFEVEKLPLFDIEYLFLNLRAVSVGEVVNLKYKCNNQVLNENSEAKTCGNLVEIDLKLTEIVPEFELDHDKKIQITEKFGVVMKYPDLTMMDAINTTDDISAVLSITIKCIDYVYDAENVYYAKDFSEQELQDFIDQLQMSDIEKIKHFFDTMPKLKKTLDFKCFKCHHEDKIELEGIQSFFG
jgi:hypothetical protein